MSEARASDPSGREMPRQQVLLAAEIAGFGGGVPSKHRVRDLSSSGARIDHASNLRAGSTVLVSVGVLQAVGATVVWVKGDLAGLKFAEPIDPDAARSKAIVTPAGAPQAHTGRAGWIGGLEDPYRARR